MDDEDAKRVSQRKMVWFALSGMVMYPVAVVTCSIAGFDTAAQLPARHCQHLLGFCVGTCRCLLWL